MLPTSVVRAIGVFFAAMAIASCRDQGVKEEREFFRQPLETRVERLRSYPLETQYKIFRYGNDVVHPPLTNLAVPIAERGADAVPFLMNRLSVEMDDFAVRDILQIVQHMERLKTYSVKSDESLLRALNSRVSTMKDKDWQAICLKMLDDINGA